MGSIRRARTGFSCAAALLVAACGAFSSATEPPSVEDSGPPDEAGALDGAFVGTAEGGSAEGQAATIVCSCPDAAQESVCESFASLPSAKACGWNAEPSSLSFGFTSNGLVVPTDATGSEGFLRRNLSGWTTLSVDVTASLSEMKSLSTTVMHLETDTTTLAFILYKGLAGPSLTIGLSGGTTTNVPLSGTFKVTFVFTGNGVTTTVRRGIETILETTTKGAFAAPTFGVGIDHVTTPVGTGSLSFSNFRATFD